MGLALESDYDLVWKKCANLPSELYGASVALLDDKVYVMAGGARDKKTLNHVFVYDINCNQWNSLPDSGHRKGILHIIDKKLTIIGGQDTKTKDISNKLITLNIKNEWTIVFPGMLKPRINPGVVTHLNYIIVMGGAQNNTLFNDDIELLDWKEEPFIWLSVQLKLPEPMWVLSPTISKDQLYIVGYNRKSGDRVTTAYRVPVNTITSSGQSSMSMTPWIKVPKAPHAGTAILPNSCPPVIIGGQGHEDITSDITMLDTQSNSWKKVDALESPRRYAAVVSISDDSFLVIGGCTGGIGREGAMTNSINTVEKGTMKINST